MKISLIIIPYIHSIFKNSMHGLPPPTLDPSARYSRCRSTGTLLRSELAENLSCLPIEKEHIAKIKGIADNAIKTPVNRELILTAPTNMTLISIFPGLNQDNVVQCQKDLCVMAGKYVDKLLDSIYAEPSPSIPPPSIPLPEYSHSLLEEIKRMGLPPGTVRRKKKIRKPRYLGRMRRRLVYRRFTEEEKKNIFDMMKEGLSQSDLARRFDCSRTAIRGIIERFESCAPSVGSGGQMHTPHNLIFNDDLLHEMDSFIASSMGSVTVKTISSYLEPLAKRKISMSAVRKALRKLGYSFKYAGQIPAEVNSQKNIMRRIFVLRKFLDLFLAGFSPVCIDESGFDPGIPHTKMWLKPGMISATRSKRKGQRLNLILAVSQFEVIAAEMHVGATNHLSIISFLDKVIPFLKQSSLRTGRKYFIFWDNAQFHLSLAVQAYLTYHSCLCLYNAPYSCFMNPVELVFNYVKQRVNTSNPPTE